MSYIGTLLDVIFTETRRRTAEEAERKEKAAIAKAFNDRYTYRHEFFPDAGRFEGTFVKRGFAWMCPECNQIHQAIDCTGLTGLQYPKCCSHYEGHRLYASIKTL